MTALMTMAATARPPGIGDARVPCPLCGGLIHPVAGRCKHCKQDLTSFRAGRPQAAATLPALNGHPITAPAPATLHTPGPTSTNGYSPPVQVVSPTGTNGHVAAARVPAPISQREGSQPILPPRQTGSWQAKDTQATSLWRSWPMIVIGVAVLAIVTAVVIMVLPQDHKASGKKIGAPPPAPERMDVDPTHPKSSQLTPPQGDDPWAQPDDPSAPPDPRGMPSQPPVDPFAGQNQADPNNPNDLFGALGGNTQSGVMVAMLNRACKKLKSCPGADLSTLDVVCSQFTSPNIPTPTCDAAKRCFDAIDALPCDQQADISTVAQMSECVSAMNGC